MLSGVCDQVSTTVGMGSPLSDAAEGTLNAATATKSTTHEYRVTKISHTTSIDADSEGPPSSPYVADPVEDLENISPSKISRLTSKSPIDRSSASPMKTLKSRTANVESLQKDQALLRSPRKLSSPEKRFPVKPSSPQKQPEVIEKTMDIKDILRDNEGLTKAIQILEDGDRENKECASEDTLTIMGAGFGDDDSPNMDDTMVSTFSAFSAVPDMTTFANLGRSSTKHTEIYPTPRRTQMNTPATSRQPMRNRSPSPTPRTRRSGKSRDEGNTTNLILDFTEQFNGFSGQAQAQSPTRRGRQSPLKNSTTLPDMSWANTPSINRNNMSNLLDFDIPPAPTPRSMPTITPRELESLKSGFLSEISSLKASLSGKAAEVQSLKTAVGDAEKRVGESMEQVREERNLKEQLAAEKEDLEKRGREMEAVLRNVKEEIVHGERERDELEGRLDEIEGRRQAAEMMAQEAESKMAAMKAGKAIPESESKPGECVCGGRAVELAVEKVSRELHTLYKEKHETKVAALKKSYERRWDKKIRELEDQVEDLSKENEDLKLGRDTTMTKVEPKNPMEVTQDLEKAAARDSKAKELKAELEGLQQVVKSIEHDNSELRKLLDEERVEKGKLVATVDEMLPLIEEFNNMINGMDSSSEISSSNHAPHLTSVESLRGSISRASGLRAPISHSGGSAAESRIGRGGFGAPAGLNTDKGRSGSAQGRPGSGMGYRSKIMSSIETMGSYKGRGE